MKRRDFHALGISPLVRVYRGFSEALSVLAVSGKMRSTEESLTDDSRIQDRRGNAFFSRARAQVHRFLVSS